jgi:hypothetical protein
MNTTGFRDGNLVHLANFIQILSHLRSGHSQRKKGGRSRFEIDHGEEKVRRATATLFHEK